MAGLLFVFVDHGAGIRRATYLCLDCAKNVDKSWNITVSFIIHVNFDHAWAEHYPVTIRGGRESVLLSIAVCKHPLPSTDTHKHIVSNEGGHAPVLVCGSADHIEPH